MGGSAPGSRLGSGRDLPFSHVGEHSGDRDEYIRSKKLSCRFFGIFFGFFNKKFHIIVKIRGVGVVVVVVVCVCVGGDVICML